MLEENGNYFNVLLPNGIYPRAVEVIGALHSAQRRVAGIRPTQRPLVYFRYLTLTKRIGMKITGTASNVVGVKFSPALSQMLGFDADTTYDGHAEHIAKQCDLAEWNISQSRRGDRSITQCTTSGRGYKTDATSVGILSLPDPH